MKMESKVGMKKKKSLRPNYKLGPIIPPEVSNPRSSEWITQWT